MTDAITGVFDGDHEPNPQLNRALAAMECALRPAQLAAACDGSAEIRTNACAGSGKTRTLAYRIAWLLARGATPSSVVAFTFTEKAAEGLKFAVSRALVDCGLDPALAGAMFIGTIHGFCQHVLGDAEARYRQFTVLDENRLILFLISRRNRLGLKALQTERGSRYFEAIKGVSGAWKTMNDELLAVEQVAERDVGLGAVLGSLRDLLKRDQYIDFSLMIREVVDRLRAGDAGTERAVSPILHLLVDEYQDVNPAQEALIRELHRRSKTLFVVGDDDQAIYGWRGADVGNIIDFPERYPGCAQHTLSHNFRSTAPIVETAAAFAEAELGATRIPKHPTAHNPPGPRQLGCLWFDDRESEAAWVADRIAALLGTAYQEGDETRGLTPGDFLVVMRSTRTSEQDESARHGAFTRALSERGIPFTLEAGGGVMDRPQVAALRAAFELLRHGMPNRADARAVFDASILPAYPAADFGRFALVVTQWGRLIHAPIAPGSVRRRIFPQQFVHELLESFSFASTPFDAGVMRDVGMFSRIMQDVETVYVSIDSAIRFQEVLNFLDNIAGTGYDLGTDDLLRRPDAVTVATVHKMKGLEFPAVFIVDVEAQRFPGKKYDYDGWLPDTLIEGALARGAYRSSEEEEARLFYVAMTRAERYLYVSGAALLPGGARRRRPSPFALRITHADVERDTTVVPVGLAAFPPTRRRGEEALPTSYSDTRYYLACPYNFKLRKIDGFSPPIQEMMGYGQTVHAAVCQVHDRFPDVAPTPAEARAIAEDVFHLQHVHPSGNPETRPGGYENARKSAGNIVAAYVEQFTEDFTQRRRVEAPFELNIERGVVSGSIDLLLKEDADGRVVEAGVLDFKAMKGGATPEANDRDLVWTDLALQVQLYAKAAREVLGEAAANGSVHLLKDNQRIAVPVTEEAIDAAVANIEFAVDGILARDFPMRPEPTKCSRCDFQKLCPKRMQAFDRGVQPPNIHVPAEGGGVRTLPVLAFQVGEAAPDVGAA